jgi:hypothetical protein
VSHHAARAPPSAADAREVHVSVATVSIVIAAASVVVASAYYSFMVRNQMRLRRTDLAMRLYATWDSLEFQEAFHAVYWSDTHDLDTTIASLGGRRHVGSYLFYFYDGIGALLRHKLIDIHLVDDLLGNSTRQLWEKVEPALREARVRSNDPRLYEHFEFLYHEMTNARVGRAHRRVTVGRHHGVSSRRGGLRAL